MKVFFNQAKNSHRKAEEMLFSSEKRII